jgi:hypothetical protein
MAAACPTLMKGDAQMPKASIFTAITILVLGLIAVTNSTAVAELATATAPACRFTLERGAPTGDGAEIWSLTCHERTGDRGAVVNGVVRRLNVKFETGEKSQ